MDAAGMVAGAAMDVPNAARGIPNGLLSVHMVAERRGVSDEYVNLERRAGRLRGVVRRGTEKPVLFRPAEVDRWLAEEWIDAVDEVDAVTVWA